MQLIQELLTQGVITQERKQELLTEIQKTEKTEEEVLLKNRILDEDALFRLKSAIIKVPLLKPNPEDVPLDVLELISEEAATNYKMAPLFKKNDVIGVGMVYPENILAQNALRFLSRKENFAYEVYLISLTDLQNMLKQHKTLKQETKKALEQFGKEKTENISLAVNGLETVLGDDEAPIIKMVLVIQRHAIEGNASDIHIEPSRDKLNVRFRQDGVLHLSLFLPLSVHASIVARIKILSNLKIDENRIPQDGRSSARINNKDIDFRVATLPTLYGEKVELRVLNPQEGLKSLDDVGLSPRNLAIVQKAMKMPHGLIVASGPTGSGKTTTLYTLLRTLNQETINTVTIEDPIEYSIAGVNQSQVRPEIGYSFSEGLRQILRQDPDVIMVGEMRDEETAHLVIHAALTGHVVLSSLHTNSAVGVIPRLIDTGVKPFLIPSTLQLAISQRLIRTLCDRCKKKVKASDKIKAYVAKHLKTLPSSMRKEAVMPNPLYLYEANGCDTCNFKGYKGRIGLFELLEMTDEVAQVILKNPVESDILRVAQAQGMVTMAQEGILKAIDGQTTIDEVTRVTEES